MDKKLTTESLAKLIWIGGSPCSGKSACAEALSQEYHCPVYRCDDYFAEHMAMAEPSIRPALHRLKSMTWNEIWMRPVEVLLQDEITIYHEEFELILGDLTKLDGFSCLIVEGAALLPELLKGIGVKKSQVLYFLPSRDFQYEKYSKREFIKGILAECANPEAAFRNWMERDQALSKYIQQKAMTLDYRYLPIDGGKGLAEIFETTKLHFQSILPGPQKPNPPA